MNTRLRLALHTNATQYARLVALQQAFAEVCNALAPIAQQTACWNRVALHHMAYKAMRQRFPGLGSQMVCNAIYSVSRSCRLVYQHPKSPFNLQRLAGKQLPRVHFLPQSPVYFDRHTLSLKGGQVSLFTLDGRMRFELALSPENERRFREDKLREIVLMQRSDVFELDFHFVPQATEHDAEAAEADPDDAPNGEFPEYMLVLEDPAAALPTVSPTPQFLSPAP